MEQRRGTTLLGSKFSIRIGGNWRGERKASFRYGFWLAGDAFSSRRWFSAREKVCRPVRLNEAIRRQRLLLFTVTSGTEPKLAFSPSGPPFLLLFSSKDQSASRSSRGSTGTRAYFPFFFPSFARSFGRFVGKARKKRRQIDRDKEECAAKARRVEAESKRWCNLPVSILLGKNAAARKFCSLRKVNLEKESFSLSPSLPPSLFVPSYLCSLVHHPPRSPWSLRFIRFASAAPL